MSQPRAPSPLEPTARRARALRRRAPRSGGHRPGARERAAAAIVALVGSLLAACAPVASPKAELGPGPDRPVPTSEPRAELGLRLDLEPLRDCEERFDLALYANRAVELITWDEQRDRCEGRLAVIRYLRRLTDDKALLEAARALALRVERAPTAPVAPPASSPHRGAPSPTP